MAKNTKEIQKIVKIIIKSLSQNHDVWHIRTEIGKHQEKKIEETICPKDIFSSAMTNYSTLINVMRLLSKSVDPVRKNVEEIMQKMKEDENKPKPKTEEKKSRQLTRHEQREIQKTQKQSLLQAKNQVSFLTDATEALKKNFSSEGMLEKIALALVLTEAVTYQDIENEIKSNDKYEIDLPITKYPDLASMQTQHSGQMLSIIESLFSMGGTVAKTISGL